MEKKLGIHVMKKVLATLFMVLLPFAGLRALDFVPNFIETEVEAGVTNREIVLKDGSANVLYCPPVGWQSVVGERSLRFHPPGVSLADFTIEADKAEVGRVLDAAALGRCRDWLKGSVPRESSDVIVEDDDLNPGSVANCPTFGMSVAYTSAGVRYRKRVIFAFAYDSDIRFTIVARLSDFDRLYAAVRQSLFSWRWESLK